MAEADGSGMSAVELVRRGLDEPGWGWSLGRYGAVAEFARVAGDGVAVRLSARGGEAVGRLGAIRISLPDTATPLAYEALSSDLGRWQHGLAFCVPAPRAMPAAALTEAGADRDALRACDRDAALFDMGVGAAGVAVHVRSAEPALLAVLRRCAGRPLLTPGNAAMAAILAHNPHRVFVSALGRIEVYQPIGTARTPSGPHTHLLPRLLAAGRAHSANIPVPAGLVAPLIAYPPNPVADADGRARPFDPTAHGAFQALLAAHGRPEALAAKRRAEAAVARGLPPPATAMTRVERTALRVALRQLRHICGAGATLDLWQRAFEPAWPG